MKPLIVGAGPVGLVVAALLAQRGVELTIIDKRPALSTLPRGIAINQRTLEILEAIGVLPQVQEIGIRVPGLNIYRAQRTVGTLNFDNEVLAHPYFFHIRQCELEQILVNRLTVLGVSILHSHRLIELTQSTGSVSANVQINQGKVTLEANWVIGCDGGTSTCCDLAEVAVSRHSYGGYFCLADLVIANPPWKPDETHYFLGRDGYLMLVPAPGGETRVIVSFRHPLSPRCVVPNAADFEQWILQRSGYSVIIERLKWVTQAPFGHRLAARAVAGRVLLAGDALHQFSPIGGTNMNIGIADAHALANALENDAINAYETSRLAVVQQQVAATRYLTRMMVRPHGMPMPRRPFKSSSLVTLLRDELPRLLTGMEASSPGVLP